MTERGRRGQPARTAFRLAVAGAFVAALAACGGGGGGASGPAPPNSPAPTPPSASASYRGVLTATVTGAPVAGATLAAGGVSARSGTGGSFALALPDGDHRLTISAPGFVSRATTVRAPNDAAELDVIPENDLWNLDFYREIARNGAGGGELRPLRRWDEEPEFYIDIRPEPATGRRVSDENLAFVVRGIGDTVKLLTGGRLTGERITVTDSPPPDDTPGTVILRWNTREVAERADSANAFAYRVGGPANVVVFRDPDDPYAVHHEIGHVLGLYHPLSGHRRSHMWYSGEFEPPYFTVWDVFHARVLYSRPAGNTDVDVDPVAYRPAVSHAR